MKAVQISAYGGNEVVKVNTDVPRPLPKEKQLLVAVYAASINPVDWKIRAGYMKDMAPLTFPATMGGDFAGVIVEVGTGVSDFAVGDEVYGNAVVLGGGSGSFAEFVAANAANTGQKPVETNFLDSAALPLAGVSALQALEDHIKLSSGQKILIHGGAGGIGSFAIQIAKAHGAYVDTTVNSNDIDFVKALGADEVVDYKNQNFAEVLRDADAVFDTVGGETLLKSFQVVKKGGIIVSMLGKPDEKMASEYGVVAIGQFTQVTTERLHRLAGLVDSGKVRVQVEKVFPLDQAKEAIEYLEKIHPRGKVVLKIKD